MPGQAEFARPPGSPQSVNSCFHAQVLGRWAKKAFSLNQNLCGKGRRPQIFGVFSASFIFATLALKLKSTVGVLQPFNGGIRGFD
jgi:hypothetical protein